MSLVNAQQRTPRPMLYKIIRAIVKLAMAVFFQKIELRHGEYVPDCGPVLFVANHPNSIMDALVMGLVTNRKVNYMGHAGLFSNKIKKWFLSSCGVIPVYRRQDAANDMDKNVRTFAACYQYLEKGETIGVFPEGTSDMMRKVKKLKTGAARIALEAERRNGYNLGLQVIPVGLYFFSRSRFRSKVLLNVGKPIALTGYFAINEQDNHKAVQRLTQEIQNRLERLTVNIQHDELDQFVRDIEQLYRGELQGDALPGLDSKQATAAEFFLTQKIAECVHYYYENDFDRFEAIRDQVDRYKRKLKWLSLKDDMLKDNTSFAQLTRANALRSSRALLGLPLATYGIVNNFMPYYFTEHLAKRFVDERTKILSALLLGGALLFISWYSLQVFIIWSLYGEIWSLLYLLGLPLSGFFALKYVKEIRIDRERLSLSIFVFTNRQLFNKMRRERKKLITALNSIKDEYLQITAHREPGYVKVGE